MMNMHTAETAMSGEAGAAFLPSRSPHRLLWATLLVSLAVHAGLAAALLQVRSPSRIGTNESAHVISIALVAAPSKPKPQTETPFSEKPVVKKPVVKKKLSPVLPQRKKPEVAVPKPVPVVPSASISAPADGDAVVSSVALETRARGRAAYGRLVWKRIAEAKLAGLHRKGSVDIRFVITSRGALRTVEVLRSTGHAGLEALARETLARAAPFPPPPAELGPGDIAFEIPFNFQ